MNKGINIKIIKKHYQSKCALGVIFLNDFYEYFEASLDYWTVEQYELQWKEGLKRLDNHNSSCLITAINDPEKRRYINWWLLYRTDEAIYIQNHIIIDEIYESLIGKNDFTSETCYNFIPPRHVDNDDPDGISEWLIKYDVIN